MAFKDEKIDPNAKVARNTISVGLITAVSQAQVLHYLAKVGYAFRVTDVQAYCLLLAGNVTARVIIVNDNQTIGAVGLAIDAVDQKFQVSQFYYDVNGTPFKKAAATAIVFSAAYTVNNAAAAPQVWGAFLVQIDNAGAVTTLAHAADQTYASEATAIANLPAAATNKVAIGYITVKSKASTKWTANTDGLDSGAEADTVNFYDAEIPGDVLDGSYAFASLTQASPTLTDDGVENLKGTKDSRLAVIYTSDGTGVLTGGRLNITVRPTPMGGEV